MNNPSFAQLNEQSFDVAIIGGGVVGAGVARDAALRGLRVALFEKEDFASGTSSAPTRLIHGGLRYLELLDFGLVRQDLGEREILLRIAPHLVRPLLFVVPMWSRGLFYRLKLKIGMILYDLLSYDKSLPNHHSWNREETLKREPKLNPQGLQGSLCYYDAQVPSTERLVLENILDARDHGAQIWNHTEVTGLLREGKQVNGVRVRHAFTGETAEVRARLVINVAGPWLDGLTAKLLGEPSRLVRMTKGIHFTSPPASNHALVLFTQTDNRLFFVIPWLDYAWVGTTDTDYEDSPDTVRADGEDVLYLQTAVETFMPAADWQTIYYTTAGLRALVRKEGVSESEVSRKHELVDYEKKEGLKGMISVVGGKLTAYRGIAEEIVDLACKKLRHNAKARTAREPLPGARLDNSLKNRDIALERFRWRLHEEGAGLGLDVEQLDHLMGLYGAMSLKLLALVRQRPELGQRIHPEYPDILAQIHHAVAEEYCATVTDFMARRSMLIFTRDQGVPALPRVAEELGKLLNWSPEQLEEQSALYCEHVARSQAFRTELVARPQVSRA
jgi:glycerol-3-phosphate dehydrogenase